MRRLLCLLLSLVMVFALIGTSAAAPGIRVRVDNEELQFDAQPFTENDRTLVPVRALAEKLGFTVGWDEADQKVTLTRGDTVILLWIGSNRVVVNGKEGTIDVPPKKVNDRTFIPVRFVSEQLGTKVQWNDQDQTVSVTTGQALLQKMTQQQAQQTNRQSTGDLLITMEMGDPAKPASSLTFKMPMHIDTQSYQNESLSLITMEMPAALGLGELKSGTAVKGGKVYTLDATTHQWRETGSVDLGAAAEQLRQSQQGGMADLMQVQADALKNVTARIVGEEELNGVKLTRLEIDLSKVDYSQQFLKSMNGLVPSGPTTFAVKRFTVTYLMDPGTLFVYKAAIGMSATVEGVESGKPISMKIDVTGEIVTKELTQPIQFPDLNNGVSIDAYWAWFKTTGNPTPCFNAADEADSHWADNDYAAGKAAASKAAGCFALQATQWQKQMPPADFAAAHNKLTSSFGGLTIAYSLYGQAFDLAAKGDVAGAKTKKTSADILANSAESSLVQGVDLIQALQEKYGLE